MLVEGYGLRHIPPVTHSFYLSFFISFTLPLQNGFTCSYYAHNVSDASRWVPTQQVEAFYSLLFYCSPTLNLYAFPSVPSPPIIWTLDDRYAAGQTPGAPLA